MTDGIPEKIPEAETTVSDKETDSPAFVLSGCLTAQDAIAAHRLATKGFRPKLIFWLIASFSLWSVLLAIAVSSRRYSEEASNAMFLGAFIMFPGLWLIMYSLGRYRLRKAVRLKYGMFAPTYSTFTSTGFTSESAGAKGEFAWTVFSHMKFNDKVALLYYRNAALYVIVARNKLHPPSQWSDVIALLREQLPKKENAKGS